MNANNYNISQEDFEAIERYLLHEMSPSELETFSKQLDSEQRLNEIVNEHSVLLQAIEEQSLRGKLNQFHESVTSDETKVIKLQPKSNKENLSWIHRYRVAASIVLIMGLGSLWYFTSQSKSNNLYNNHFFPDPGLPTLMSSEDSNFTFYDAMVNYKRGEYKTAINKWESILAAKPKNDTLNYFIGVAKLAEGDASSALPLLEQVTMTSSSVFINEAYFYLGLANLKNGNLELAKINLAKSNLESSKSLLSEFND